MSNLKKRTYDPERHCGAKTRQEGTTGKGSPCTFTKGQGTDHPGQGRCKFHGGRNQSRKSRNSLVQQQNLRKILDRLEEIDSNPLDLEQDLILMRALLFDYIERHDTITEALLAWWDSWKPFYRGYTQAVYNFRKAEEIEDVGGAREALKLISELMESAENSKRPKKMLDITEATNIIEKISRVIERIHKIKSMNVITEGDFIRAMKQMGLVVRKHVTDENTCRLIAKEWDTIPLGVASN